MEAQIKRLRGELNEGEVTDKDITRNYGSKLKSIEEYSDYEYTIQFRFHNNVGVRIFVKGDDFSTSFEDGDAKRATSKHKGKTLKSVYNKKIAQLQKELELFETTETIKEKLDY